MLITDVDDLINQANAIISSYLACQGAGTSALEDVFYRVTKATSNIEPTGRFSPKVHHVNLFLTNCNNLLCSASTSIVVRSRILLALLNFCEHNVNIRRYLVSELRIISAVCKSLSQAVHDNLGPQSLIDILRLLQYLTYGNSLVSSCSWADELLNYLMKELRSKTVTEWQPYCASILCNLASNSKAFCHKIVASNNYREVDRQLVSFLGCDSRTLVISSLVLLGYLNDKMRDMVFAISHVKETFLCVFNIIKTGENVVTRLTAMDLCKRLIVSDSSKSTLAPTLASSAKDLLSYGYFDSSVQKLAGQMVLLDARTEESKKLYEMFLDICSVPQMKSPVCGAVLLTVPSEVRLTTPVLSMWRTASLTFEEAIDPEIPLLACELLTMMLKEATDSGKSVHDYLPLENMLQLISNNVKTPVETQSELVTFQCRRITCGLKLADAISSDDEARRELLDILTAPLCSHINESQLVSNPVISYMNKPPALRNPTELPSWSLNGVMISLELFKLLSSLKDHNKTHKDAYWMTLRDGRIIPFLAYAIYYGDHNVVHDALKFFSHCTQLTEFPTKLLGDLISSCSVLRHKLEKNVENNNHHQRSVMETNGHSEDLRMELEKVRQLFRDAEDKNLLQLTEIRDKDSTISKLQMEKATLLSDKKLLEEALQFSESKYKALRQANQNLLEQMDNMGPPGMIKNRACP